MENPGKTFHVEVPRFGERGRLEAQSKLREIIPDLANIITGLENMPAGLREQKLIGILDKLIEVQETLIRNPQ